MGWASYGGQNSNWEKQQFLEKCFFTYEPSRWPFFLPIPSCIPFVVFPMFFRALGNSPWTFLQCYSFFPCMGIVFIDIQWQGSLMVIFGLFLHPHNWEFHVLCVAQPMGDISMNLGTEGVIFSHMKP